MPLGVVKWFSVRRGFGFISDGDGADVFVHHKAIEADGFRRLHDGEEVEYEAADGPRGRYAVRVRLCGKVRKSVQPVATGSRGEMTPSLWIHPTAAVGATEQPPCTKRTHVGNHRPLGH